MQLYTIITVLTLNGEITGIRISALSNSIKNLCYMAAICSLVLLGRINCVLKTALIVTCVGIKAVTLPPLTNTLFSIHPPLLYLSFTAAILSALWKDRPLAYAAAYISFLAMLLGGLWSMQELSWGG